MTCMLKQEESTNTHEVLLFSDGLVFSSVTDMVKRLELLDWLTCVAVVVQQWLSHATEANNPVAAPSTRLNVSAVPIWH